MEEMEKSECAQRLFRGCFQQHGRQAHKGPVPIINRRKGGSVQKNERELSGDKNEETPKARMV